MRPVCHRGQIPSAPRFGCCFDYAQTGLWLSKEFEHGRSSISRDTHWRLGDDIQPKRCLMRAFNLRTVLCLTLLTMATTTVTAGVRGKPTILKPSTTDSQRVSQNDADYSVNAVPVPADVHVTNERVIQETNIQSTISAQDPNCATATPIQAQVRTQYVAVPVPVMAMPMMVPAMQPMQMPMMPAPQGCATCGGMSGGLSPAAAAAYGQTFGPGLYRSGAEAGQNHFPYYSYRRPWYFPGQPSFQRSTDYVW